jgi:hypothetical protein
MHLFPYLTQHNVFLNKLERTILPYRNSLRYYYGDYAILSAKIFFYSQYINASNISINVYLDGHFEIKGHPVYAFYFSQGASYYFNPILSAEYLKLLTEKLVAAYPSQKSINISYAVSITWDWYFNSTHHSIFYQVVLCTDMAGMSYMIVSYDQLDDPPTGPLYFQDPTSKNIYMNATTYCSNCGVPGQYIYQFVNGQQLQNMTCKL